MEQLHPVLRKKLLNGRKKRQAGLQGQQMQGRSGGYGGYPYGGGAGMQAQQSGAGLQGQQMQGRAGKKKREVDKGVEKQGMQEEALVDKYKKILFLLILRGHALDDRKKRASGARVQGQQMQGGADGIGK
ncbi:hypothetical protein JTE90_010262 [Oedothorax gibbosus]|uniref:Uncharacterized protein n=1 Tax=Oedothorax gibbosus TaxID=931172 RepID=A0AAV6TVM8_9ARAC|nr:hypothetical protein JTE90_010262 [Oedothorax gibbosus]